MMSPDWKPSVVVPSKTFCAVASAAVNSARPAAVLSEIADDGCVCEVAAFPLSRACKEV